MRLSLTVLLFLSVLFGCHTGPAVMQADRLDALAQRIEAGEAVPASVILPALKNASESLRNSERDKIAAEQDRDRAKEEARTWIFIKTTFWIFVAVSFFAGLALAYVRFRRFLPV